jgi:hypothetical protein
MAEVIEMKVKSTVQAIADEVADIDFEVCFDPDERLPPKEREEGIAAERQAVKESAESAHLGYRAVAAYFAELANIAEELVTDACSEKTEANATTPSYMWSPSEKNCILVSHGSISAIVDSENRKLPIVTLTRESKFSTDQPGRARKETLAKYRYNPGSDKLQRIG